MVGSPNRLMKRVQQRLQSVKPGGPAGHPTSHDVLELEARVRKLRALGDRFIHVKLSQYVAKRGAAEVPGRLGGECVATEVVTAP